MQVFLLFAVFLISVCALVYQLLAGTISSYLVGDSVYQFSLVIGIFVSSMGLGSFISRFISRKLHDWFILVELLTGVVGGMSSIILFFAFTHIENYTPILILVSVAIGTLVGLELPIILRIVKEHNTLKIVLSNVMTADYAGALFASLLFPIVLVPHLGLIRTSLAFGTMNVAVASAAIYVFRERIVARQGLIALAVSSMLLLGTCFAFAGRISTYAEDTLYQDEIIYTVNSPYQRVVVTRTRNDIRMFINGSIQFSSQDEYRYHEALVLPAMAAAHSRRNILVIGGGDGLAAREILKFPDVEKLLIVDIDPAITGFARNNQLMRNLNCDSMRNPKTRIVNEDAWKYLEKHSELYDVIIIDLPDPDDLTLSRLYSRTFYRLLAHQLAHGGKIVTQATSPLYSHKAFWCIHNTLAAVENPLRISESASDTAVLDTEAYGCYIPSFGSWGFVMASNTPIDWHSISINVPSRFVSSEFVKTMNVFPPDIDHVDTEINTIDTHVVKSYYEEGWDKWAL
ncbi:MAG: Spermidine synthase N-terminal extension / Spermidine synthase [Candidatus Rifleibacterium amylolyticum]|nr:MAG: Spermidine synthase N-terminal extension / Spermidine synthase [Candidatus Rifleibacterium amylolyticum]